jgi:anion-transporting  ArsA/GET3 family ATPase
MTSPRLYIVSGKGGVGRSTTAIALALALGAAGRRTALVELSGNNQVGTIFGWKQRSYAPISISPNTDARSLTPTECFDDFIRNKLNLGSIVSKMIQISSFGSFIDAVPGLNDLIQLGKIENLLSADSNDHYDAVVLDGPATGHGETLLESAISLGEMTKIGPFHDLAKIIETLLSDPIQCGLVIATTPEPLPLQETLSFIKHLRGKPKRPLVAILNRCPEQRFPNKLGDTSWETVSANLLEHESKAAKALLQCAKTIQHKDKQASKATETLQAIVGHENVFTLPEFSGAATPAHLSILADALTSLVSP